ncbi:hypothetical protein PROFUN_13436 [Planoprotostelium fungivorum]|uniref:Uncharacterized protein n=1 Tax=Planoprotostelium fungivorum TaxID=1890364 RepID=A0A2P6N419_9EUKA|nr:hypothetical protein PROFUN_13436 [Planoprotostelium fungivorum]
MNNIPGSYLDAPLQISNKENATRATLKSVTASTSQTPQVRKALGDLSNMSGTRTPLKEKSLFSKPTATPSLKVATKKSVTSTKKKVSSSVLPNEQTHKADGRTLFRCQMPAELAYDSKKMAGPLRVHTSSLSSMSLSSNSEDYFMNEAESFISQYDLDDLDHFLPVETPFLTEADLDLDLPEIF